MNRFPGWIGRAALAAVVLLDTRTALAQCPTRVEPSFIATLQHPGVVQTAWAMTPITPDNVKLRGGLRPMMDAEQRQIDADQAAISVQGQAAERNGDRLAMLRDDARLHREYLRLLQCHATTPFGPGASATVNIGGAAVTVSGGARRPRNPGSDLVNAFLNRAPSEAIQDKARSERAANDAARTEFNTQQVDATGAAGFVNTELTALRSSLSALPNQKLADEFAFLAGDAPKPDAPAARCPAGTLGFRGYCAAAAYLAVASSTPATVPAGVSDAAQAQRAVRALKAHAAAPDAAVDPVLEYFELGLEQEGSNGERFLEPVGQSATLPAVWAAFQSSATAQASPDFLFDLLTTAPPPPTEDAITVGLRQADDALQELVAGRSGDFRPGPGGTTLDDMTREMCVTCGSAPGSRPPASIGGYAAVARLLQ